MERIASLSDDGGSYQTLLTNHVPSFASYGMHLNIMKQRTRNVFSLWLLELINECDDPLACRLMMSLSSRH